MISIGRQARASIRWRLTGWYSGMLAVTLILFAAGSLVALSRVLAIRHDRFLDEARGAYVAELVVEYGELGTTPLAASAAVRDTRFNETWVFVFDSTGALLARGDAAGERGAALQPMPGYVADSIASISRRASDEHAFLTVGSGNDEFRVVLAPVVIGGQRLVVAASQSQHSVTETLQQVATGYLIVVPLALLLSALGGYLMARRALAPMAEMTTRARTIGATNLNARLDVPRADDEVGELAGVINDLLGRLERAFALQRRFVADASHELRTPVTTICAEADIVLAGPVRPEREYRESLSVIRDAGRRLARVVEELFVLARIDSGHLPVAHEPLYLDELVVDAARSVRALAQARSANVVTETPVEAPLVGDPALLERMVINLLDNAIKYSPACETVRVRLVHDASAVQLIVSDRGPGIPPEVRDRIFERFFRVDATRSRADGSVTGGAGLGLSIARWVAEAHGGTLMHRVPAEGGRGSEFVATIPLARS